MFRICVESRKMAEQRQNYQAKKLTFRMVIGVELVYPRGRFKTIEKHDIFWDFFGNSNWSPLIPVYVFLFVRVPHGRHSCERKLFSSPCRRMIYAADSSNVIHCPSVCLSVCSFVRLSVIHLLAAHFGGYFGALRTPTSRTIAALSVLFQIHQHARYRLTWKLGL